MNEQKDNKEGTQSALGHLEAAPGTLDPSEREKITQKWTKVIETKGDGVVFNGSWDIFDFRDGSKETVRARLESFEASKLMGAVYQWIGSLQNYGSSSELVIFKRSQEEWEVLYQTNRYDATGRYTMLPTWLFHLPDSDAQLFIEAVEQQPDLIEDVFEGFLRKLGKENILRRREPLMQLLITNADSPKADAWKLNEAARRLKFSREHIFAFPKPG